MFDTTNHLSIMVYICDTFHLSHDQMMRLKRKSDAVLRLPSHWASLPALAIVTGLAIGFGATVEDIERWDIEQMSFVALAHEPQPMKRRRVYDFRRR